MPEVFSEYASCRIILDCTEIFTAVPKKISSQIAMYSDYKHRITMKGLVGIAPNGTEGFVSELFPGSTSDKVVEKSKILSQLVAGDFFMADKGFLIGDILPPGVTLNIPRQKHPSIHAHPSSIYFKHCSSEDLCQTRYSSRKDFQNS